MNRWMAAGRGWAVGWMVIAGLACASQSGCKGGPTPEQQERAAALEKRLAAAEARAASAESKLQAIADADAVKDTQCSMELARCSEELRVLRSSVPDAGTRPLPKARPPVHPPGWCDERNDPMCGS
jgi:uncharacterized coiled-coil protein SlyX